MQTISINGTGFANPSTVAVTWTGGSKTLSSGEVSFVNSTLVQMTINTSTTADNWTVKITNPNGQVSNAFGFLGSVPLSSCSVECERARDIGQGLHSSDLRKEAAIYRQTRHLARRD